MVDRAQTHVDGWPVIGVALFVVFAVAALAGGDGPAGTLLTVITGLLFSLWAVDHIRAQGPL